MSITDAKDQESWLSGFLLGSKLKTLLGCPFCGCEAEFYLEVNLLSESRPCYRAKCSNCCRVESQSYYEIDDAIKAWNERFKEEEK